MTEKKKDAGIPQHAIEKLARCLFPEIQKFFESEAGNREFEEWKKQQQSNLTDNQN